MTSTKLKKVLIMAGGTGGHIFPALAVADVLQQKGAIIEWLGTRKGLESRLVPEHHYPINFIEIAGLRGKGFMTLLLLPLHLTKAIIQAFRVYSRVKPDVVLGMGGFVTGPGGLVAWFLGKPLILHEQNAIAGMSNKILYKLSKKVFAAFPGAFNDSFTSGKKKNKKLRIIGNPVRKEITTIAEPEKRFKAKWSSKVTESSDLESDQELNILVIGGSLGAAALNERIPQALEIIIDNLQQGSFERIHVRHQCGEKNLDVTRENYQQLEKQNNKSKIDIEILPFIRDMAANYKWADLIICRSGALTVSEIAAAGVASLLVPFPYAVDDHQTANAAYLADEGAAFLIQQNDLDKERLADLLLKLNKKKLLTMAVKARQLAINNAAEVVADECLQLAG